MEQIS
jgi:hypothetical protein